jgi:hypothetical protein
LDAIHPRLKVGALWHVFMKSWTSRFGVDVPLRRPFGFMNKMLRWEVRI